MLWKELIICIPFLYLLSLRIRLMCLFVTRFDFLGGFSPQNKLVEWIQLIVINLIYSSSANLMDCIHKVSVKNPYDFPHLIQDKLQHLQIG